MSTSPPLRMDHIALPCFDARASHRFYGEVLGFSLVDAQSGDDWGGWPWLMMIFAIPDGRVIALVARRGVAGPGPDAVPDDSSHIAFAVPSERDLDAWRRRLADAQVAIREEDHGTQRSIYFTDPSGTVLEITTPSSDAVAVVPAAHDVVARWLAQQP
jgi:catechol 2,3-dioxygenase-like lactoylglutathione lyase family enzyme